MNKFKKGTYTGYGKGIGNLSIDVTVDENSIKKVNLHLENETSGIGRDAEKDLSQQIIKAQSTDIDGVSGASLTTRGVKNALKEALDEAQGKEHKKNLNLKEGHFIGTGLGHGGELKVDLSVFDNRIGQVKIIESHETPNVGDNAVKIIPEEIVKQQTLNVDAVTGATLTSKAIINATEDAIQKADGDVISWQNQPFHKKAIVNPTSVDVDLAIAGSGLSGLALGAFAAKKGLKVALVDKNDQVGGSSRYAGAIFALANSDRMKELGVDAKMSDIVNFVQKVTETAEKPFDMAFLKKLMAESGKTFDELVSMTNLKAVIWGKSPITIGNFTNGAHLAELLHKYIEDRGGQFFLASKVEKINVVDDKATGLEVENAGGHFTINAKAVVISTGGASYNQNKLLDQVTPSVTDVHVFNEANPNNTGDGYELLKAVGAEFSDNDVYKNGTIDFAPQLFLTWNIVPDYSEAMLVDEEGKRFTNEAEFNFLNVTTNMLKHGSSRYYLIYDSENIDESFKKKLDRLPENKKVYVKGKSIEEIAEKLNLDANNLRETFNAYQNGNETFGKPEEKMKKFSGHGFYAVYAMPGSWGTVGGVKIDHDTFQVKTADGKDFANLYAVGEMSTSDLFSEYYMGGFSYATYTTEGRLLADQLAKKLY